jgi:hypothetical protein
VGIFVVIFQGCVHPVSALGGDTPKVVILEDLGFLIAPRSGLK